MLKQRVENKLLLETKKHMMLTRFVNEIHSDAKCKLLSLLALILLDRNHFD